MRFLKKTIKDLYFLLVVILIKSVSWSASPHLKTLLINTISFVAYHCSRTKRRLIESNVSTVFAGKLDEAQRRRIVKGSFRTFWQETFSLLPAPQELATLKQVPIQGIERLHQALKNGKGVILWESSSFGYRSLAKQILHAHGFSLYQVHLENHFGGFLRTEKSWISEQIVAPFFDRCEKRFLAEIIWLDRSGSLAFTRTIQRRLHHNAILCISGDARFGQKQLNLDFLGHLKPFPTGMVSLAKVSGAVILPLFCIQEHDGTPHLLIESPICIQRKAKREEGLEKAVRQYANLLESYIHRNPEQYRFWHFELPR